MKNILSLVVVMMMSVMTSFSQVYYIHVDTIQYFKHSANMTTYQAEKADSVEYCGASIIKYDFIADFNNMTFTTINVKKDSTIENIVEIYDSSDNFDMDIVTDKNEITRVFVDESVSKQNGFVICVRWNKMIEGVPTTLGWFSRNVVIKKGDN